MCLRLHKFFVLVEPITAMLNEHMVRYFLATDSSYNGTVLLLSEKRGETSEQTIAQIE